jgi:amino-acid N-acetyltransferase
MPEVAALLSSCGLPSEDIGPNSLPNFVVAKEGTTSIGVAGLEVKGSNALIRSVGVALSHRHHGLGAKLLAAVEARAKELGVQHTYLLTNDAQAFFARHGYAEVPRCSAPAEIQACSQFGSSCCGAATLMSKQMRPNPSAQADRQQRR